MPYDNPRLLGAKNSADAAASPFVIAIESAGSTVLPGIMNGVILIAVLSVGNSAVYGSSRTLAALADQGQAPKFFGYVDRRGRPLVAILFASALGLLAYLAGASVQGDFFDWLLAVSGLSSLFTWGSICLAHIRFRKAWSTRHRSLHDLAFRAQAGTIGSWIGFIVNILILAAQMWVAISPIESKGDPPLTTRDRAKGFFLLCMALPIVLVFYIGHKLWFRTGIIRTQDMDIDTGRRDFRLAVIKAREEEEQMMWPTWKKVYRFLC